LGTKHIIVMLPNLGTEGLRVNKIDGITIISYADSVGCGGREYRDD
jgi:hypothetical protein